MKRKKLSLKKISNLEKSKSSNYIKIHDSIKSPVRSPLVSPLGSSLMSPFRGFVSQNYSKNLRFSLVSPKHAFFMTNFLKFPEIFQK